MTNSPNQNNQPEPNSNRRPRLLFSPTGLALVGVPILVGLAGGAWWLWAFVQNDLAPLVQKTLTQTLKRPVQVGRVERFSLTGLRLGPTSVPATSTDPDRASVEAVEVSFNPLQLLLTRTLKLDITLVNPDVYVEQDAQGNWLAKLPSAEQKPGLIKTELDTIQFNNAGVVLVPNPKTGNTKQPFKILQVNGSGQLLDRNQLIAFYLDGQPVTGGTFKILGESRLNTQQTNLKLQAQNLLGSDVTRLVDLPLDLQAGRINSDLAVQLKPERLQPSLLGTVGLKAVTAQLNQLPQPFINTQGTLRFKGTQVRLENISTSYGKIPAIANGVFDTQSDLNITARVNKATLANAQDTFKLKLPVPAKGNFRADLRVTGPILKPILSGSVATLGTVRIDRVNFSAIRSQFALSTATSTIALKDIQVIPAAGGKITGAGKIQLEQPGLGFNIVAENVPGDTLARLYGASSPQFQIGAINARAKISGTPTSPKAVVNWRAAGATYPARGQIIVAGTKTFLLRNTVVRVAGGTVRAAGQLAANRWQASVQATNLHLGRLAQVPPALQAPVSGAFNFSGTTASYKPETISLQGSGGVNIAGGTITASSIQLARGRWQGSGTAAGVQLERILPQPQRLPGTLDGRFNLSGSLVAIKPETIQGNAIALLRVAGGTVRATNLTLGNGRWVGTFAANGVEMGTLAQLAPSTVSPQLQGRLNGNVNASGSLTAFNLAAIQAEGQLRLLSFAVNGLDFDSVLSGEVSVRPRQGLNLQLAGVQDRIELVLSPTYRPVSFLVRRDQAVATGRTQGNLLSLQADNFPISILKTVAPLPAAIASQPVAGELSGNAEINLNTFAGEGNVAINKPVVGPIKGDSFVGQLRYANGMATLTGGELIQGESRYTLAGSVSQSSSGPKFQGQLKIAQGQIQNILTAVQSFDLQAFQQGSQPQTYARARDVQTVPVSLTKASLLTQLRRFSEIEALLQQQRSKRKGASQEFSLADLKGTFNGEISLKGSLKTGVAVKFDLEGNNWEWQNYEVNQIVAQGSFENGVLTLAPLQVESDETFLAFKGQVGGSQQSGQLQVRNFPLDTLKNFVKLPVDFTGQLNARATLAGSRQNPQVVGKLQLADATLDQKPIESAQGSFSYTNARLSFSSKVLVAGPAPIAITGSVPYSLPFASVQPDSEQIRIDVNVQNEGLALLNLLTDQVAWEGGQGQVELQVRGTLKQPVPKGFATINNATISAQALPEPLTDVTGTAQFSRDRIEVEGVRGRFSRGSVEARGVIPIFASLKPNDPDQANPLTVNLDKLALNLKDLYKGGVNGKVEITGAALNPLIGGEVRLNRGEVILSQAGTTAPIPTSSAADATGATTKQLAPGVGNAENATVPGFNNLRLILGDDIEITRSPILKFQATGTLTINGSRNDLRPNGTIRLRSGGINLFTTEFELDDDYEQTATFKPNQGLDPTLNIRLVAKVPEVTQSRVPDSPLSSEINQPLSANLGTVDTVRVQARIQGPASQLDDNLELTSNPSRSETEIIALIGGGFVQTLGRSGGSTGQGLVNFAGSALLDEFQGTFSKIGNSLGLSELRIYPTDVSSEQSRGSTLGLAAEAGIDVFGNVSVSVIRVLTADQPTQFGLNYRVNDSLRLRTATDLTDDSRAVVEYENRF